MESGLTVPEYSSALEPLVDAYRRAERIGVYLTDDVVYEATAATKFLQAPAAALLRQVRDGLARLADWTEGGTQGVIENVASTAGVGLGGRAAAAGCGHR